MNIYSYPVNCTVAPYGSPEGHDFFTYSTIYFYGMMIIAANSEEEAKQLLIDEEIVDRLVEKFNPIKIEGASIDRDKPEIIVMQIEKVK